MALIELKIPDIGDVSEAAVIEILVKPGDTIKAEQSLITIESDKASMEVPASQGGVLKEIKLKLGDKVSAGALIGLMEVDGGAAAAVVPLAPEVTVAPQVPVSAPAVAPVLSSEVVSRPPPTATLPPVEAPAAVPALPHASPSVRSFARELGVPLEQVSGSGPKGRITAMDVQTFVKAALSRGGPVGPAAGATTASSGAGLDLLPWPKVDFAKYGPIERRPLSRIQKLSGANLHRNWVRIPHVTNNEDADITELEAFRVKLNEEYAKAGPKFTLLAFLLKACAAALKRFPQFNASLDGDDLVLKQYVHIGFAADTPNGLVVPVIRDVDTKGLAQLATETAALAAKAREGK
ncbi:MAG: 2-oxo acid dehydrogenase subunit E2, partial [Pseudomonadota bacterium]